jgi:hypothetical protein
MIYPCKCKFGKRYWRLVNSWGEAWGEEGKNSKLGGRFRMERGKDLFGIESIGESANIRIIDDMHKLNTIKE